MMQARMALSIDSSNKSYLLHFKSLTILLLANLRKLRNLISYEDV